MENNYLLFDGDCGFCNKTVLFLAKKDQKDQFIFVSNVSPLGIELLQKYQLEKLSQNTIILVIGNKVYTKTNAIARFFIHINYFPFFFKILAIMPKWITNLVYDTIAANRKRIIKNNTCELPSANIARKIING